MKIIISLIIISTYLFSQTVHSSVSSYYESKSFSSSLQKEDAAIYGIGADIHHNHSAYKITYEYGKTNTIQPPLKEDLKTEKLFLKYMYEFNESFEVNVNYIKILKDNIAITDNGTSVGLGLTYNISKPISINFTQFYTNYDDFDVLQSDFTLDFKMKINDIKFKISSLTKYMDIDERDTNPFTKNAKKNYLTSGIKLHAHYKGYHFGTGVYLGKRVFGIMNDGFKIQHHAMEIDRTYAIGIGKDISDFVVRTQYVYQRATELPSLNENVEVKVLRLIVNYKF